jgi:hypothetical protein
MKRPRRKNFLNVCATCSLLILIGVSSSRADDTTTNSAPPSQSSTSSPSYDDTMKWIQKKLDVWSYMQVGDCKYSDGSQKIFTQKHSLVNYDDSGNLAVITITYNGTSQGSLTGYLDLSSVTNVSVRIDNGKRFSGTHQDGTTFTTVYVASYCLTFYSSTKVHVKYSDSPQAQSDMEKVFPDKTEFILTFPDKENAERIAKAFQHAISLVKKGPF